MSAILSTDALNDFISPSVACIKPIENLPSQSQDDPSLEHEVILGGQQQPPGSTATSADGPSKISLTDCLACSGCVTSAEAVLVSLQSHNEVLSVLDAAPALKVRGPDASGHFSVDGLEDPNAKLFVASVSPQTRASLAAACGAGTTESQAGNMIEELLKGEQGLRAGGNSNNGFSWVVDTNTAREACLVLGADEVRKGDAALSTPILTSSCPGWICYAEKTHPHVLPHLSRVKSPQALMGTLLKTTLSKKLGITPDRIWHLAVMPCLDKKLEASREELTDSVWAGDGKPGRGTRDVDCVITSKEVLMLSESRGIDFFGLPKTPMSQTATPFPDPRLHKFLFSQRRGQRQSPASGTSGGNLHFILQDMLSRHPGAQLQAVRGRNVDVVEYIISSQSGEPLFKAAKYYGFRNIQNIVRKLKPAKASRMPGGRPFGSARKPAAQARSLDYSYIEVMACPGGCTNGGGQVKVSDPLIIERNGWTSNPGPEEQKQWLAQVDEAYFSASDSEIEDADVSAQSGGGAEDLVDGISPSYIRDTLAHWSDMTGIDLARLARTSFREVISDVGKDNDDKANVVQLAGKVGGGW
ncbi:hypothetical protein diail_10157 [Diaporthe ilicicola]|nr:hypothetical protein diail_10157 [Diaporthe ilicicola]